MNKFSKIEKNPIVEKDIYTHRGKYINQLNVDGYEFVEHSKDLVLILPYLVDEGSLLLCYEPNPGFKYKNRNSVDKRNNHSFLTCISGGIEKNESIINAIRRELYEESGLVLPDLYEIGRAHV